MNDLKKQISENKGLIIGGILFFAGLILTINIIRGRNPDFFEDEIRSFKQNKSLMDSIGGYDTYEYTYNKYDLETDTLDFNLIIYGNKGKVICNGIAVKDSNKMWHVIKKEKFIE